jgi:hypothetical protein
MSTEESDDEYLPGAAYDSDDSRVGADSIPRPFVTSRRPRTRALVSNNPDIPSAVQSVGTITAPPPISCH